MLINKNQLISKVENTRIVPFDYKPVKGENVFDVYLGSEIPAKLATTMSEEEFHKIFD